jgi:hypothetical protein
MTYYGYIVTTIIIVLTMILWWILARSIKEK